MVHVQVTLHKEPCTCRPSGVSELHGQAVCARELRALQAHSAVLAHLVRAGPVARQGRDSDCRLRELCVPRAAHSRMHQSQHAQGSAGQGAEGRAWYECSHSVYFATCKCVCKVDTSMPLHMYILHSIFALLFI